MMESEMIQDEKRGVPFAITRITFPRRWSVHSQVVKGKKEQNYVSIKKSVDDVPVSCRDRASMARTHGGGRGVRGRGLYPAHY